MGAGTMRPKSGAFANLLVARRSSQSALPTSAWSTRTPFSQCSRCIARETMRARFHCPAGAGCFSSPG